MFGDLRGCDVMFEVIIVERLLLFILEEFFNGVNKKMKIKRK